MRGVGEWAHMASTTVQIQARSTGLDGYGKPSFGAAVTYQCHLARQRKMVRTAGGQEAVSEQAVYLMSGDNIQPTAKVTMSTADVGSTEAAVVSPPILAVQRRFDQGGPHHMVLYLG